MTPSKQERQTAIVELAETANIARSIKRIQNQSGGYDDDRWKRALYHALGMCHVGSSTLEKIRQGLGLP